MPPLSPKPHAELLGAPSSEETLLQEATLWLEALRSSSSPHHGKAVSGTPGMLEGKVEALYAE